MAHHGTTDKLVWRQDKFATNIMNHKDISFFSLHHQGGTLVGQTQTSEPDSSDEDKEQEKDRSLRLSDEQLFKLCKGRTAHK